MAARFEGLRGTRAEERHVTGEGREREREEEQEETQCERK